MRETSSSEVALWKMYLEQHPTQFNVLHYYLAQIAREIRFSLTKKTKLKISDFLIKFTTSSNTKTTTGKTSKELAIASKSRWGLIRKRIGQPRKKGP